MRTAPRATPGQDPPGPKKPHGDQRQLTNAKAQAPAADGAADAFAPALYRVTNQGRISP